MSTREPAASTKRFAMLVRGMASTGDLYREPIYLATYDVEAHEGLGDATWTDDITKAATFGSWAEAVATWNTQSVTRPLRPDGKPNRPLTALTIEVKEVPDGVE